MVNGKMYIGQAVDIERRWRHHKNKLRGNDHDNEHLQRAWNKYKEDNFEFTIICECEENQLNTKEIDYIAKLKTYDRDFGYNKTYGGEGGRPTEETRRKQSEAAKGENHHMFGKHHSEEAKRKQSEAKKGKYCGKNNPFYGKHHSAEARRKMSESKSIPIVQIDASTNKVINVWESAMDAEIEFGCNHSNIIKCCKGKRKTHKGYKWQYLHEVD